MKPSLNFFFSIAGYRSSQSNRNAVGVCRARNGRDHACDESEIFERNIAHREHCNLVGKIFQATTTDFLQAKRELGAMIPCPFFC
jgi:hypothetical protein